MKFLIALLRCNGNIIDQVNRRCSSGLRSGNVFGVNASWISRGLAEDHGPYRTPIRSGSKDDALQRSDVDGERNFFTKLLVARKYMGGAE